MKFKKLISAAAVMLATISVPAAAEPFMIAANHDDSELWFTHPESWRFDDTWVETRVTQFFAETRQENVVVLRIRNQHCAQGRGIIQARPDVPYAKFEELNKFTLRETRTVSDMLGKSICTIAKMARESSRQYQK